MTNRVFCKEHSEEEVPKELCHVCLKEDEIASLKDEIASLKYELNNSQMFHCPHFLTTDGGHIACHKNFEKEIIQIRAQRDLLEKLFIEKRSENSAYSIEVLKLKNLLKEATDLIRSFDLSFQDKDWRNEFLSKINKG